MTRFLLSLVSLTGIFLVVSGEWSRDGVILGLGISFGILLLFLRDWMPFRFDLHRIAFRGTWAIWYLVHLLFSIFVATIDLSRVILSRDPSEHLEPSVVEVPTTVLQDSPTLRGILAHGITITPGEMVIGSDSTDDEQHFLVHKLYKGQTQTDTERDAQFLIRILQRIRS